MAKNRSEWYTSRAIGEPNMMVELLKAEKSIAENKQKHGQYPWVLAMFSFIDYVSTGSFEPSGGLRSRLIIEGDEGGVIGAFP